jgi:hypothetical protein
VGACSLVRLVVCARLWDTDSRVDASLCALWSKCLPWDENVERNEFLLIAYSLGIVDAPRHFLSTRQVLDALRAYAHHGQALHGVPPSDDMFERLDSLPQASLVALACLHGLDPAPRRLKLHMLRLVRAPLVSRVV